MDTNRPRSPDAAPTGPAVSPATPGSFSAPPEAWPGTGEDASRTTSVRLEILAPSPDGGLPDAPLSSPASPASPASRRPRHDGWTPERKRRFLEHFAECGVVAEACQAVGISKRAAYNLRDRDSLFAAGWEAAGVLARPKLADEAYSRAMNGVVERIYKDGVVVAERHRYDNRLTMSVLGRLDARIDRAEETGAPHLGLVARWADYLDAIEEERDEDGIALLAAPRVAPPAGGEVHGRAGEGELRELQAADDAALAACDDAGALRVWDEPDGWWTDYPPPPGFDGMECGDYGESGYRRTLSAREQAVIDADLAEERAEEEAARDEWFGFTLEEDDAAEAAGPPPGSAGAGGEAERLDDADRGERAEHGGDVAEQADGGLLVGLQRAEEGHRLLAPAGDTAMRGSLARGG